MQLTLGQKFFFHSSVYVASHILNVVMGMALMPIYSRHLGPGGVGMVGLLASVAMLLNCLYCQGLVNAWNRLRFRESDREGVAILENSIVWYLTLTMTAIMAALWFFGEPLARLVSREIPFHPHWRLVVPTVGLGVYVALYKARLQMEQRPFAYAVFSTLHNLVLLATIIYFVAGLGRGVRGKLEADLVAGAVLAVAALWLIRPGSIRRFSAAKMRYALAYSLPLTPHVMAIWTNDFIDRVLVTNMLGLAANGVYTFGCQIPLKLTLVMQALNKSMAPLFLASTRDAERLMAEGRAEEARRGMDAVARMTLLLMLLVACAAIVLTAYIREVLAVLIIGEGFEDAWQVAAPTAAGMVALSCYYVFAHGALYETRGSRRMVFISGLAAAVNLSANVWLIPRMGILGAALATFVSNVVMALACIRVAQAMIPVPHRWGRWGALMACCLAGLTGLWLIDGAPVALGWRLGAKALVAAAAMAGMVASAGFRPGELWDFCLRMIAKGKAKRQS